MRGEMSAMVAGKVQELRKYALTKFRPEIQTAVLMPDSQRTPYQRQIALMAEKQLQGAAIPASAWERLVLPARVPDFSPAYLDELERDVVLGDLGLDGEHLDVEAFEAEIGRRDALEREHDLKERSTTEIARHM